MSMKNKCRNYSTSFNKCLDCDLKKIALQPETHDCFLEVGDNIWRKK